MGINSGGKFTLNLVPGYLLTHNTYAVWENKPYRYLNFPTPGVDRLIKA